MPAGIRESIVVIVSCIGKCYNPALEAQVAGVGNAVAVHVVIEGTADCCGEGVAKAIEVEKSIVTIRCAISIRLVCIKATADVIRINMGKNSDSAIHWA